MIETEFVGRAAEVERGRELLELAIAGDPAVLLVSGEAGAGKSTYTDRLVALGLELGYSSAEGQCTALASDTAWSPFMQIADDLSAQVSGDGDVVENMTEMIRQCQDTAPLLVVLEDLHWADISSRSFLTHLATTLRDERLMVIATLRTPLVDDSVRSAIAELTRVRRVETIDLGPLERADLRRLMRLVLHETPSEDEVADLHVKSGGNAFLARELIRATERGHDVESSTVNEVVRSTLAPLPPEVLDLLGVASLIGPDVDPDLLSVVTDLDIEDIERRLDAAVAAGALTVTAGDLSFRHDLLRQACHSTMLQSRRRRIHGSIADALVSSGASAHDLAHHQELAGRAADAYDTSRAAAKAARGPYGSVEATAHDRRVLRLWAEVVDAQVRAGLSRAEYAVAALEGAFYVGDTDAARAFATIALDEDDSGLDIDVRTVTACRLSELEWQSGNTEEALAVLAAAEAASEGLGPRAMAHLLDRRSFHAAMGGDTGEALDLATEALDLASGGTDPELEVEILQRVGLATALSGSFEDGMEMMSRGRELAFTTGHHRGVIRGTINLLALRYGVGDLARARADGELGNSMAEELGAPKAWQTHAHAWLARTLIAQGDLDGALHVIDNASTPPAETFRSVIDVAAAELAVESGDHDEAAELLDRVDISLEDHMTWWLRKGLIERRLAVATNRPSAALAGIDAFLDIADRWPDAFLLQVADVALQALPPEDDESASAIAKRCRVKAELLLSTIPPADSRARLLQVEARLAERRREPSGALWLGVAAEFERCGRPIEAGWALVRAASADDRALTPQELSERVRASTFRPPAPLLDAVDALVGPSTGATSDDHDVYSFGDYEVDVTAYELRRRGEHLAAEPQVFDLIAYMVKRPGELLTKEQLLDDIWGDRFVSPSALAVRVKTARQLLGDDGRSQHTIRTVHGRGYKFVAQTTRR